MMPTGRLAATILMLIPPLVLAGCGGNEPEGAPVAGPPGTPPPPPPMVEATPRASTAEPASAPPDNMAGPPGSMAGATMPTPPPGVSTVPPPPREDPLPADLPGDDPGEVARVFLETPEEAVHLALMTEKAQRAYEEDGVTSHRDPNSRFEFGEVTVDDDTAEVAMKGEGPTGRMEPGTVKLRREGGAWRVHAMTMAATDEHPEMTMDFENPMAMFGELGAALSELGDAMEDFGEVDPEAETRSEAEEGAEAAATFEAIEAVDPATFRDTFLVDLALDGRPAGAAIAELAAPLGLQLDPSAAPNDALDQPVTMTAEGITRLEAIERVCRAVGLYATYGSPPGDEFVWGFEGDAVTPVPGPRPWPVTFAGPLLIEVLGVDVEPTGIGTLRLRVLGLGLPAATVELLTADLFRTLDDEPVVIRSVAGPGGEELLQQDAFPGFGGFTESPSGVYETEVTVRLANLLRSVTAIAEVRGRATIPVPTKVLMLRFDPIRPGAVQEAGGLKATLRGDGPGVPNIRIERPEGAEDDMGWIRRIFLLGRDRDGNPLESDIGGGGGDGRMYDAMPLFQGEPASIDLKVASEVEEDSSEFRLGPIPLKDFARMPEAMASLDYAGHDAPVSAEFVGFLDDQQAFGNNRPYTYRLINHSNKDVRSFQGAAIFYDAGGKRLADSPINFSADPLLVAKHDTKEQREFGFNVPREAATAELSIHQVAFTDGKEWEREPPEAVERIEELGGNVQLMLGLVSSVTLSGKDAIEAAMPLLDELGPIKTLSLRGAELTDEDWEQISHLEDLQRLDLSFSKITDEGLEHLKGADSLRWLNLNQSGVTDRGVEGLVAARPELKVQYSPAAATYRRAGLLAGAGEWEQAAEVFEEAAEREPDRYHGGFIPAFFATAVSKLMVGDFDGYRRECSQMMERFAEDAQLFTAEQLARACTLRPGAVDDPSRLLTIARRALDAEYAGRPGTENPWFLLAAGAAAYRAGESEHAVEFLTKSLELQDGEDGRAEALLFLALAEHELGQTAKASRAFEEANRLVDAAQEQFDQGEGWPASKWLEWPIALLLRQETAADLTGED